MGKANKKRKKKPKRQQGPFRADQIANCPDPKSPEAARFVELVNECDDDDWCLTPEECVRDLSIIKSALSRALKSHITVIAPEIMRECQGLDPPDHVVDVVYTIIEQSLRERFDAMYFKEKDFREHVHVLLQFLKIALVESEIRTRLWAEFMTAEEREEWMNPSASERKEQPGQ